MKSNQLAWLRLPIAVLLLSILFTACTPAGGADESSDTTVTTAANENETTTTPDITDTTSQQQADDPTPPTEDTVGWEIGKLCPTADIAVMGEDTTAYAETYNIESNRTKLTVINFWYTQCVPCIQEMPHFDRIATEYAEELTVLAIHADLGNGVVGIVASLDYIDENYYASAIRFGYDAQNSYYQALGGTDTYPRTLIVDAEGKVAAIFTETVSYDALKTAIDSLLENEN